MHLSELLHGVELVRLNAPPTLNVTGIVSDSRRAVPGCLFLCLRGTRTDGHNFIPEAVARGAAAVVTDPFHAPPDGVPCAVVIDTRAAAARIWNNYYGDPSRNMRTAAVTGTNGKTSTSYILRAILEEAGFHTGLIGTVRCLAGEEEICLGGGGEIADTPSAMTTPDPEYLYGAVDTMRRRGTEILILETSSHALSWHKPDALKLDLGVFTNLSPEHLDYHGTMDAYLRAKARLFALSPAGILNMDDPYAEKLREIAPDCAYTLCSPAGNPEADVRALRVQMHGMAGVEYLYYADSAVFRIRCPVPGRFSVENTLLAVSAALQLGADPLSVQSALEKFTGVEGRMQRVVLEGADFSLFLDYAHTPAALEALLRTVREARRPEERIVLLFGCGGDRDPAKRPVMGRIASALADFVIVTSDNSRSESPEEIISAILRGVEREKPYAVIPDRREAIRYAINQAKQGDILLLCGKGHEKYEIKEDGMHPLDEAETARLAWKARRR